MSSLPPDTDPRRDPAIVAERDIRPVVARPRQGLPAVALLLLALAAGLLLFLLLNGRRQANLAPSLLARSTDTTPIASPPPLYLPPTPVEQPIGYPTPVPAATAPVARAYALPAVPMPRSALASPAYGSPAPVTATPAPSPARTAGGTALVADIPASSDAGDQNRLRNPLAAPTSTDRVRAGIMANRSTTVPQGTLIPAVLETAFDSTAPGFARALVQRDVRGFDGTQVLIPRGSRLIGEYGADTAQGQNRAIIAWSRLIRPDGVTIAIGSPAADPVGRGGVKAEVNSHFFQRFAGAILQSALDVGVNLASRSANAPVIVALPGSTQGVGSTIRPTEIRPTLRVPAGRTVSVFVARDLDFTGADLQR